MELVCTETYFVDWAGQGEPNKHHHVLWRSATPFVTETQVHEGLAYGGTFIFEVPADATPTASGEVAEIRWTVQASVDVTRARDLHHSRNVNVFTPVPNPTPPTLAEEVFGQGTMSLSLSSGTVCAGERLHGQFSVRPKQEITVGGVRVVLECWEKALDKQKFTIKDQVFLEYQTALAPDQEFEWPIRLHIPKNRLPSTSVDRTQVVWRVKGILDRSGRTDLEVLQEIQVYTAP